MTMETALRTRLKNNGTVAGLVSTRIDWGVRPQGNPYPSIVLTKVSDQRDQHMLGFNTFRPTRVQVDCYAATYAAAVALRDAVIAALVPEATVSSITFLRPFINNVMDRGEDTETGYIHRQMIDLTVWHN